jgi:Tfp pilus assembly protein PilF
LEALDDGLKEPGVTLNVALLALLKGDETQAEKYFKETLELEETNPDAHLYLGS